MVLLAEEVPSVQFSERLPCFGISLTLNSVGRTLELFFYVFVTAITLSPDRTTGHNESALEQGT